MIIQEDEPEEFITAKGMFYIATMIDLSHTALNYLINAKKLLLSSIQQHKNYLPNYYYLALTSFRMGIIRAENGQYQQALIDLKIAKENFEAVKLCEQFKEDLLELLPSLHEAYSYVLEQIGYIIYEADDFDYHTHPNIFHFLSAKIM
jgi:hypothetical protein